MKKFFVSMMLISSFAHAESLQLTVSNFNFDYTDPHGTGTATSFTRNKNTHKAVAVQVDRLDKDFRFVVTGAEDAEFEFKDAPTFMTEAERMTISGFNLNLSQAFSLSLGAGRFESKDNSLKLDNLTVDCNRDSAKKELMEQLISGCIQRMNFKAGKFNSQAEMEGLMTVLSESLSEFSGEKSSLTINSVNLKSSSGKYELTADVKAQISGKVKSNGNLSYDENQGMLTVKISEVKFGILNITGKVFDELKKKESDKLKVKKPYVYYSIK